MLFQGKIMRTFPDMDNNLGTISKYDGMIAKMLDYT